MRDVRAFLKRNGFKKMEVNSYANDKCNVVFEQCLMPSLSHLQGKSKKAEALLVNNVPISKWFCAGNAHQMGSNS